MNTPSLNREAETSYTSVKFKMASYKFNFMIVVSVTNTLPAGLTCASTLARHVFANFQGDGIPSKGENRTQRSYCQKLHVSTPTISELLLCMSAIITLQPISSACAVSSVAVFG